MGRRLLLQDDTFLQEIAWFPHTDKAGLSYWFLDPPILDVLESGLDLDLAAFRLLADDGEDLYLYFSMEPMSPMMPDELQAQVRALRQEMDTAWQPPEALAAAIEQVLGRIDTPHGFPEALVATIQALPIRTTISPKYYLEGVLAEELRDLRKMVQYAVLRGATRVRLLHR